MSTLTHNELETMAALPLAVQSAYRRACEAKDAWLRFPDDEAAYERYADAHAEYGDAARLHAAAKVRRGKVAGRMARSSLFAESQP